MSKIFYTTIGCLLVSGAMADGGQEPAGRDTGLRAALDQAVVDGCVMCHRGPLSLQDRTSEELAVRIDDIASGRAAHPVPIPELSDRDLQALAGALGGG